MILGEYIGEYKQMKSFTNDIKYDDIVKVHKLGNSVQFVNKITNLVLGVSDISTIEGKYKLFEKVK